MTGWPAVTLLLLASSAVTSLAAPEQPPTRIIVPDLTQELAKQLQEYNINTLVVLPGPKQPEEVNITWSELQSQLWRLEFVRSFDDFQNLLEQRRGLPRRVGAPGEQPQLLHDSSRGSEVGAGHVRTQSSSSTSYSRHLMPQRALPYQVTPGAAAPQQHQQQQQQHGQQGAYVNPQQSQRLLLQQQQQQQQQLPSRLRVAILTLATDGVLHSSVASLALGISRRLHGAVVLSLTHNPQSSTRPQSLVTFDSHGTPVKMAAEKTTLFRDAFSAIYNQQLWGAPGGGSGEGSGVNYTTSARKYLKDVLQRYNIRSMLDSSCGSMHWLPRVLQAREQQQPDFRFTGTDVVCSLIDQHKQTFAAKTNWGFECIDYAAQPLPAGYELVFSRDSLQHVPFYAVYQFLNNVRASGAKYLLVGSYVKSEEPNQDISGGVEAFLVDLLKPPFNVSQPLEVFDEEVPEKKHLLLFEVSSMTWSDSLDGLV